MKGFGIYVKNDLLEPKHIQNMGEAVWLYLWLLDKMTSINENGVGKILGGKPIKYDDINIDLGIHRNTYTLWLNRLRDTGYINTLRTPHGLVVVVNKAQKGHKPRAKTPKVMHTNQCITDAHETVHHSTNSDAHEQGSDAHESVHVEDAHESVHVIKTKQSRLNKTKHNTTNVVLAKAEKSKPEINELFVYWQDKTGLAIQSQVKANRYACNNLLKRYSPEQVRQLIDGVAKAQADKYAPRIADFRDLQSKLNQLLTWGKSQVIAKKGTIKV